VVVAAVVQYISANVYIPALRILLRANRSSPVFFSLRVYLVRARDTVFFYPVFFFRYWGKFFFRALRTFSGVVVRCPRPLFAPLCGGKLNSDARDEKNLPLAVETVANRHLSEGSRRVRGARPQKTQKKEMKTLN
jgi:hypothetical protein